MFAFVFASTLLASTAAAQSGDEPAPDDDMAPVEDAPVEPAPEPAPPPQPVGPAPVRVQPGLGGPGGPGFGEMPLDHHAHTGFFGRVLLGFGYQQMTEEFGANELKVSGAAGTFLLSLGYSVIPSLALHVDLGGVSTVGPTIEFNGMESEAEDATATTAGIGFGATYYLPSNVFFGGSLMLGGVSIAEDGDDVAESDTGAALALVGGKEWWVGSNVGVGVAAHLMFGSFPDGGEGVDANVNTASFTINFSGTYN